MAAKRTAAAKKPAVKRKVAAKKKPAPKKAPAKKKVAAKKVAPVKKAKASNKSSAGYDKSAWKKNKTTANRVASEQPLMKTLRAEHRHIASVMQLFTEQLQSIENGELVDTHIVYEIMDYMVGWPDRYHHPREDMIYCRVAELDPKAADEVDTLQRDHDQTATKGRKILRDIERWRSGEVGGLAVVKSGRDYVDHMYEHMTVEEKIVFPHIESVLGSEDWRELAEDDQLRAVADPVFGHRVQREFRNLGRNLKRNVRQGVERGTIMEWVGIEALMESLDVLSMAYDSARSSTGDHVRAAVEDSKDYFRESPLKSPVRCAANNLKLSLKLLEEVAGISKETFDDLSRVNQARRDRMRLLNKMP